MPAYSDLHNLHPADATVNSARGNKFYDRSDTNDPGYRAPGHAEGPPKPSQPRPIQKGLEDEGFKELYRLDLIDRTTKEIWEIKPVSNGKGLARATEQLQKYKFNAMLLGEAWVEGATYTPPSIIELDANFEAEVEIAAPGVILYEIYRKQQQPIPVPVGVRKPVSYDELNRYQTAERTRELVIGPYASRLIQSTSYAVATVGALYLANAARNFFVRFLMSYQTKLQELRWRIALAEYDEFCKDLEYGLEDLRLAPSSYLRRLA